ncbi:hypothetical protein DOY81_006269 [Sarcophaga bullata]|nr:hypothetical protein DOY81_006269 [Sarcophaga bullata]
MFLRTFYSFLIVLFVIVIVKVLIPKPPPNYRLSKAIKPYEYNLTLQPFLEVKDGSKQFTFNGEVFITLQALKQGIKAIELHAKKLKISDIRLYNAAGMQIQKIESNSRNYDAETNKLSLSLLKALKLEKNYTLYVKYSGEISKNNEGIFRFQEDNEQRWQLITLFYKNNTRLALPCFDEPYFKAKFRMSIIRSPQYKSFFNTQLLKTTTISKNYEMDTYEVTPLMSTYLLAFMVSTYTPYGDGNLKIISPRAQVNSSYFAYETAVSALKVCELYFRNSSQELGIPVIQMTSTQNYKHLAMESWGLIILRHNILHHLTNYTDGWLYKRQTIRTIIHELTHMWFGNSVTFNWWNNLWLNEAFACYYEIVLGQKFYSSYEILQQFIVNQMYTVLEIDAAPTTQAISSKEKEIKMPQDSNRITNAINYNKGASVLRMFSSSMGEDNFDLAVREYLQENHLKNTVPKDLFKHLRKHWPTGQRVSLNQFFRDWIKQKGYPLVILTTTANNKYLLKQQHFLIDKHQLKKSSLRYTIPITYTHDKELNFESFKPKFYFHKTFKHMTFGNFTANKWLILNIQQSGYYRVFYDKQLLKAIQEAFMVTKHSGIPIIQRASIINDLFTYAKIGLITYNRTFNFIEYLNQETDYLPWQAALKALHYVASRLTLKKQERLGHMVNPLLEQVYSTLQFESSSNDTILNVLKRNLIIAWLCQYKHENCNNRVQHMFLQYNGSHTEISSDFRESLYCAACRFGEKKIYADLKEMFLSQQLKSEKLKIIKAMSCTRFHVKSHYRFLLSHKVAIDFKAFALTALVTKTPANIDVVFELLIENVDELAKSLQSWPVAAKVISEIAHYFTTKEQLNTFKKFIHAKGYLFEAAVDILHDSVEIVEDNLEWSRMHLNDLFKDVEETNEANLIKSNNINKILIIVGIIIHFC